MSRKNIKTTIVPASEHSSGAGSSVKQSSRNQDFGKRLKTKREILGLTQQELAQKIGSSKSSIQYYEAGALPKGEYLIALSETLQCSLDWLLKGEGHNVPGENIDPKGGLDLDEFDYIPMSHAELSAGGGAVVLSEGYKNRFAFRRDWLRRVGLSKKNAVMMVVRGESMEPTLEHHDTVIVDLDRKRINTGHIYAVNIGDDMLSIKRLESRGETVRVISDNRQYEPFDMHISEIRIIGQVVWYARQLVWNNGD